MLPTNLPLLHRRRILRRDPLLLKRPNTACSTIRRCIRQRGESLGDRDTQPRDWRAGPPRQRHRGDVGMVMRQRVPVLGQPHAVRVGAAAQDTCAVPALLEEWCTDLLCPVGGIA